MNRIAVRLNWKSSSGDGTVRKLLRSTGAFKKLSPCEAMDLTHQFSPGGGTPIGARGNPMKKNDVSMHSTYSASGEIRPGDHTLRYQNRPVESGTLTIAQPHSGENLRAKTRWPITYRASLLAFLVLAPLTWTQCDFIGREIPDWKPVLALADAAWEKGDLYYAKSLYLQAGKFAVWRDDWTGLLAAACGIKKLERERGPYSSTNALLRRAMVAAEKTQKSIRACCGSKSLCNAWGGQSRLHGPVARREGLGRRN
jgi:hypothetical protein